MEKDTQFNKEYSDMVKEFITNDDKTVFGNATAIHAHDIMKQFLTTAIGHVEILTGSFKELFDEKDEFLNALKLAGKKLKENSIRIVSANAEKSDVEKINNIVNAINMENKNNTIVYNTATYTGAPEKLRHFMLVDDKRYRHEYPHKDDCKNVRADVCCNDTDFVAEKKMFFNLIWKRLTSKD